ncbi:hypothetical protein BGZ98_005272, partial [Dissophora globulifera]
WWRFSADGTLKAESWYRGRYLFNLDKVSGYKFNNPTAPSVSTVRLPSAAVVPHIVSPSSLRAVTTAAPLAAPGAPFSAAPS